MDGWVDNQSNNLINTLLILIKIFLRNCSILLLLLLFLFARSVLRELGLGNAVKLYNPNGLDPAKTIGKTSLRLRRQVQQT